MLHNQILSLETVAAETFGSSLIIAPHPDDETLGCGGTIALLKKHRIPVHFIFITDGSMSHPHSKKFPARRLRDLRENEAKKAVKILGYQTDTMEFLRLKDRQVPQEHSIQFLPFVEMIVKRMDDLCPETVFVPWQKDPHPDHQATWRIMTEALKYTRNRPRLVEYPIWLWELGNDEDLEIINTMQKWSVNIEDTLEIKNNALAAHASQVTRLIDDDPDGFILSGEILEHFNIPRELFFETKQ